MLQVSAAQAEETVLLPPGVVLTLEGHGWGHGHGLSQYGAQGAALQGVPASTILATYYPGTTAGHLADSPMRVLVQESLPDQLQVAATSGLAVVDADTGTTYALPAGPARWRLVSGGAGLAVQSGDGSRWQPWTAPNGRSAFGSRATFAGPPRLRLFLTGGGSHDYRGTLTALRGTAPAVAAINTVSMDQYLYGVVPRESPASFQPAALQAQAVAARTYSGYQRAHPNPGGWDVCSSTQCQVYGGVTAYDAAGHAVGLEVASTSVAVDATAGQVRLWNGQPAFTQFSAGNGGWSVAGGPPYLAANVDPWDDFPGNPVHTWTSQLGSAAVQAAYPEVGTLQRLRVLSRDGHGEWGGRVLTARLEGVAASGTATSLPVTGDDLRSRLGLRSTWWRLRPGIAEHYAALGGPGSFLGAAVTGEMTTPDGSGRYVHYAGGSIYWSPSTGAHEVHGSIRELWSALGWETSFLGYPVTDETTTPDGVGRYTHFQGGSIYWTSRTGAYEIHGAIRGLWSARGWETGFLGYPLTDELTTPDGLGRFNHFQGGSVYWTSSTGAHEVHGAIRGLWSALGWETGYLGYPVSDETVTQDGAGRFSDFQGGSVYWTAGTSAHEVHGDIGVRWRGLGAEHGTLGYPVGDERAVPDGRQSDFQHGSIRWDAATRATTVIPALH
jgi:stage II sporulation protein D